MANPNIVFIHDKVGYVELQDHFGDDTLIVNSARVSFDKEVDSMSPADERLVRYLVKHQHISPFFHPQIRFRIKMPIYVAREWYRHCIGLSRNEVSRRYVDSEPEMFMPEFLRARNPSLKQGSSSEPIEKNEEYMEKIRKFHSDTTAFYNELLEVGVAPELARGILPNNLYTSFIETGSLGAYARICKLRLDPTAQKEIQEYAQIVSDHLEKLFPITWRYIINPDAELLLTPPKKLDSPKKDD